MVNYSLHLPVPNSVCSYDPIFQVIWNKDLKPCLAGVHWCKPVLGIPYTCCSYNHDSKFTTFGKDNPSRSF